MKEFTNTFHDENYRSYNENSIPKLENALFHCFFFLNVGLKYNEEIWSQNINYLEYHYGKEITTIIIIIWMILSDDNDDDKQKPDESQQQYKRNIYKWHYTFKLHKVYQINTIPFSKWVSTLQDI